MLSLIHISEDRKKHGVLLEMSIRDNISFISIRDICKAAVVNRKADRNLAQSYIDRLKIKTPSMEQLAKNLSGGNQQKVVLAKSMASKSDIPVSYTHLDVYKRQTLGNQALKAMITASIVAVLLVIIFMISIYRLPGVISCLTLVFQMCLQILALSIPQYTLTLPGIAGLILSVGMAVDANIIISERIGEELKTGSGIRSAVEKGIS